MVSDDSITVCGSVNMDYRSLFLHFECASMIYGTATAECAKEDFLKTCEVSTEITSEMAKKRSLFAKIYLAFIRTLEPLL